jgi:hypothetical protein
MGKASSAKKVARAARAGGNRRAGQRRQLGFPIAVALVLVVGLLLVFFARERRNADAFPRANVDHVHASIDIYTCTPDASASGSTTTTSSTATTTTAAPASAGASTTTSTVPANTPRTLAAGDVPGQYQAPPTDATQDVLGIHTHGDGLIHIHPFANSVAGRNATLGVFLNQVGISMTNTTLVLPSGGTFEAGKTKCAGGKDAVLQVAKWDHSDAAARGDKPNQIFTSGFDKVRLGANASFVIAFMPSGSTIKAKPDVADRIAKVSDLQPSTTASTTPPASGSAPPASGSAPPASGAPASGAPSSGSGPPASGASTAATTASTASTSSSSP